MHGKELWSSGESSISGCEHANASSKHMVAMPSADEPGCSVLRETHLVLLHSLEFREVRSLPCAGMAANLEGTLPCISAQHILREAA